MELGTVKTGLGYVCAGLFTATGIRSILDPVSQAKDFGIPTTAETSQYVVIMGGRTLGFGLCVGALLLQGQQRAAGTVLLTSIVIGATDAWANYTYAGEVTAKVYTHLIGSSLIFLYANWLSS